MRTVGVRQQTAEKNLPSISSASTGYHLPTSYLPNLHTFTASCSVCTYRQLSYSGTIQLVLDPIHPTSTSPSQVIACFYLRYLPALLLPRVPPTLPGLLVHSIHTRLWNLKSGPGVPLITCTSVSTYLPYSAQLKLEVSIYIFVQPTHKLTCAFPQHSLRIYRYSGCAWLPSLRRRPVAQFKVHIYTNATTTTTITNTTITTAAAAIIVTDLHHASSQP